MLQYIGKKILPICFLAAPCLWGCGGKHKTGAKRAADAPPLESSPYDSGKALLVLGRTGVKPVILDSACGTIIHDELTYFMYRHANRKLAAAWYPIRTRGKIRTPAPAWYSLSLPRNCRYQLVLPDSTTVWLNAESALYFQVPFPPNERYVELLGEALFHIGPGPKAPFRIGLRNHPGMVPVVRLDGNSAAHISAYPEDRYAEITALNGGAVVSFQDGAPPGKVACKERERIMVDSNGVCKVYPLGPGSHALRMLESAGLAHFKADGKKVVVRKTK